MGMPGMTLAIMDRCLMTSRSVSVATPAGASETHAGVPPDASSEVSP